MNLNIPALNIGITLNIKKNKNEDFILENVPAYLTEYGMRMLNITPVCGISESVTLGTRIEKNSSRRLVACQTGNTIDGVNFTTDDVGKIIIYPDGSSSIIMEYIDANTIVVNINKDLLYTQMVVFDRYYDRITDVYQKSINIDPIDYSNNIQYDANTKVLTVTNKRALFFPRVESDITITEIGVSKPSDKNIFGIADIGLTPVSFLKNDIPYVEVIIHRTIYCGETYVNNFNISNNIGNSGYYKLQYDELNIDADNISYIGIGGRTRKPINKFSLLERYNTFTGSSFVFNNNNLELVHTEPLIGSMLSNITDEVLSPLNVQDGIGQGYVPLYVTNSADYNILYCENNINISEFKELLIQNEIGDVLIKTVFDNQIDGTGLNLKPITYLKFGRMIFDIR